ncbi:hypothetical protein [Bacillus safensis]|uniref:hypothetical protein n=1 Tax=Bacillus safensis TaxID=561879 RepID=UPI000DAE9B7E|nr:hypothetical protein [Bacillus safensis]
MLKKVATLSYYTNLTNIRKFLVDWSINKYTPSQIMRIFVLMLVFLSFGLYIVAFSVSKIIEGNQDLTSIINLAILYMLIITLYNSLNFFNKHQSVFFYDSRKSLLQIKDFRVIRVISTLYFNILKSSILLWCAFFTPVYLGVYTINMNFNPIFLIIYFPLFLCIYALLVMIITYIRFIISKLFYLKALNMLNSLVIFGILGCVSLLAPYYIISFLLNYKNIFSKVNEMIRTVSLLPDIFNVYRNVFVETTINIWITAGIALFLSIVFLHILWVKTLNSWDLINYYDMKMGREVKYKKPLFAKHKNNFFQKDLLHILRANSWFIGHLGKTIIGVLFFVGAAIPFIDHYISKSSSIGIIAAVSACSFAVFQIVGDSLRMVLGVDGESKNLHLFINRNFTIWDLVREKWKVYCIFVLFISFISLIVLNFFLKVNLNTLILSLIIVITYGGLSGLFQISTTGLYPRINWEHEYEIGESHKASFLNNLLNNGITILYTFFIGALFILTEFVNVNLTINLVLILSFSLFVICVLVFMITVTFLKRVTIKEVFLDRD